MDEPEALGKLTIRINGHIQDVINKYSLQDIDNFGFRLSETVATELLVSEAGLAAIVTKNTFVLKTPFFRVNSLARHQFASDVLWSLSDLGLPKPKSFTEELVEFKQLAERELAQTLLRDKSEDNLRSLLQSYLAHRHAVRREVPTGRGKMDIILFGRTAGSTEVVETKIWGGPQIHSDGLLELAAYLGTEQLNGGSYVVLEFGDAKSWLESQAHADHWWESVEGKSIYVIFVRIPEVSPSQRGRAARKRLDR